MIILSINLAEALPPGYSRPKIIILRDGRVRVGALAVFEAGWLVRHWGVPTTRLPLHVSFALELGRMMNRFLFKMCLSFMI